MRRYFKLNCIYKFMLVSVLTFLLLAVFSPDVSQAQPNKKIEISGALEINATHHTRKYDDPEMEKDKESDITLSTVELGFDAQIHPSISGHVLLLWEEDETTEVEDLLDEATITISNPAKCPYYLTVGKMYLPFGKFDSSFITDPITLEMGEINQTAIELGYEKEFTKFSFGFFNGDVKKTDKDNEINSFFAELEINYSQNPYNITFAASYLSNLADTDGMEDLTEGITITDYVQGMGLFLKIDTDKGFLSAEYIAAIDDIEKDFLEGITLEKSYSPSVYNIELGVKTPKDGLVTLKYEKTEDMSISEALNFPKDLYGIVVSYPLFEIATVSLEYIHEKYEEIEEGKNDIITAQLAINF